MSSWWPQPLGLCRSPRGRLAATWGAGLAGWGLVQVLAVNLGPRADSLFSMMIDSAVARLLETATFFPNKRFFVNRRFFPNNRFFPNHRFFRSNAVFVGFGFPYPYYPYPYYPYYPYPYYPY